MQKSIQITEGQKATLKEASELINKTKQAIKYLINTGKIKAFKEQGKYGEETKILLQELLEHYKISYQKILSKGEKTTKNTSNNFDIVKVYQKQVEDKDQEIEFLREQIKKKDKQIENDQQLLSQQQALNNQSQSLLFAKEEKILFLETENQKQAQKLEEIEHPPRPAEEKKFVIVTETQKTEPNPQKKKKKIWQFWKK
jgi:hypothetical protein